MKAIALTAIKQLKHIQVAQLDQLSCWLQAVSIFNMSELNVSFTGLYIEVGSSDGNEAFGNEAQQTVRP